MAGESTRRKLCVDINWKIVAFSCLLMPVLLKAGFWQLDRAAEKETLQEEWGRQQAQPPMSLHQLSASEDKRFRRVSVSGYFDAEKFWLLENQVHQGRHGYKVLMPFRTDDGQTILVNRGWVQGSGYREQPMVETPAGNVSLFGTLVTPGVNVLLADDTSASQGDWPRFSLTIDLPSMSAAVAESLGEHYLQLDQASPSVFVVTWRPTNMTAQKHIGYATQWFAMAIALTILTFFANTNLGRLMKSRE